MTPVWVLVAVGLSSSFMGAFIGGIFALFAGRLAHQRDVRARRVERVIELCARMVAAGSQLSAAATRSHRTRPTSLLDGLRKRAQRTRVAGERLGVVLDAEVSLIEVGAELRALTVRSPIGDVAGQINSSLELMVNQVWVNEYEFDQQFEVTRELLLDLQGRMKNLATMPLREAWTYLNSGFYWYNEQ